MGTSIRDQWISIISTKINEKIEAIKATPEYELARNIALKKIYKDADVEKAVDQYKKNQQEQEDIEMRLKALKEEDDRLYKKISTCVSDIPDQYRKPGDNWNSYRSYPDRLKVKVERVVLESPLFTKAKELKDLINAKETLATRFLIATTQKQLKEVAESIMALVGLEVDDLLK